MSSDATQKISGFLVVRKAGMDKDPEGRAFYSTQPSCLGALCYGGIDRMPWFDLDEEFYAGTLPERVALLRKSLELSNDDLTGIRLCRDWPTAHALLEFDERARLVNEIVCLRSAKLAAIKGTVESDVSAVRWDGFDLVSLGNWSLIREGLFRSPSSFPGWEKVLNESGLLPSPASADEYLLLYEAAARSGHVEELPGSLYGFDVIEVGRLVS